MRETRETAAMRAHTAHNADLPELTLWCDLEEEEREIEERLRRLEKQS